MFIVAKETAKASVRVFKLFSYKQRWTMFSAVIMMAITGGLSTVPPLVIGGLVDDMLTTQYTSFSSAVPFLVTILAVVVTKECVTVCRKLIVENICTRIQKAQTVGLISHLL